MDFRRPHHPSTLGFYAHCPIKWPPRAEAFFAHFQKHQDHLNVDSVMLYIYVYTIYVYTIYIYDIRMHTYTYIHIHIHIYIYIYTYTYTYTCIYTHATRSTYIICIYIYMYIPLHLIIVSSVYRWNPDLQTPAEASRLEGLCKTYGAPGHQWWLARRSVFLFFARKMGKLGLENGTDTLGYIYI